MAFIVLAMSGFVKGQDDVPDMTLLTCLQAKPKLLPVRQHYELSEVSSILASQELPDWLADEMTELFQPPWQALLQGSERWQVWYDKSCFKVAMGNHENECFGLLSVCPGASPLFQKGALDIPEDECGEHSLLILTGVTEPFGTHLYSVVENAPAIEPVDFVDKDGAGSPSSPWISPELMYAVSSSFATGAASEIASQMVKSYRDAGLKPWEWSGSEAWSVLRDALWAGALSSAMGAASYGLHQSTGLWKPASVMVVGAVVRSARVACRYSQNTLSREQLPGELGWALARTGAVTGAGYLMSGGTHAVHRWLTTPGAVTGGMIGEALLDQLKMGDGFDSFKSSVNL